MPPTSFSVQPLTSNSNLSPIIMEQAMAATFAANHSMSPADLLKVGPSITDAHI